MSESLSERTEAPTAARRRAARAEGRIARSREISSAALVVAIAVVLGGLGPDFVRTLEQHFAEQFPQRAAEPNGHLVTALPLDPAGVSTMLREAFVQAAGYALPLVLTVWSALLFVNLVQNRFLFRPAQVVPRWSRISPGRGLQQIFSVANLWRSAGNVLKVLLVLGVAAWVAWRQLPESLHLARGSDLGTSVESLEERRLPADGAQATVARGVFDYLRRQLAECAWSVALVLCGIALIDYAYQKWRHEQSLKMTPQELREELRTTEGDPELRRRQRQRQREFATQHDG